MASRQSNAGLWLKPGLTLISLALVAGCSHTKSGGDSSASGSSGSQAAAPAAPKGPGPGMNAAGEVVDSSKVEAGYGKKVKGLNDWEGEITGKPSAKSKFTKLQIGMSMKQATDLVGQPTDQGAYMTGMAWVPFYFGSDRHRYEMVYKGQGRLIFAGGSLGDFTGGNLIWIIHNANEGGYR
jgi:hypothetical protein